jgi:hypothetical protein
MTDDAKLTADEFSANVGSFTNERLCEVIVVYRYLGIMQDESIACMEELAKRRLNGDVFEFEANIDEKLNTLPKFKLDMKKIIGSSVFNLSSLFGGFKK